METDDNGNGFFRTMVMISMKAANAAARIIEMMAEVGRLATPRAIRSATPFHCTAEGMGNCSETIVAGLRAPFSPGGRKRRKKSGVAARAPERIPMQCPMACCRGLAPSM